MDLFEFSLTRTGDAAGERNLLLVQSSSNENATKGVFCFLSDILGKKVYGQDYAVIGKVIDLTARSGDGHPEIDALVLTRNGTILYFPSQEIDLLGLARSRKFIIAEDHSTPASPPGRHFLVRETLLDKQIVDINGAKVERVNDVRILFCAKGAPFIDSVDVGFTGLLWRMGWEVRLRRLVRILMVGKQLKDELIAWKYVQPLPERVAGPIHINLRHEQIKALHAGELADIIEDLDRDERISLVQSISAEHAAEALKEADIDVQASILRDLDSGLAADILEEMEPASAVDVIDKLPVDTQQTIMAAMEEEDRARLEPLVRAEENTAASLMTVDFLSCPATFTVTRTLEYIRRNADEVESINYVYCMDEEDRLAGVASLRDLLLSGSDAVLLDIMNRRLAVLRSCDDWESVANQFLKYCFKALPVIGDDGSLQGIVTFKHSFDELLNYYHRLAS